MINLLINKGETEEARNMIAGLIPELQSISEQLKHPDIMNDITLMNGFVDKADGNFTEAKKHFEEVLAYSKNYGNQRQSREALEEIEKASANN